MHDKKHEKKLVEHFNNMGWKEEFGKTIILSEDYRYKKSYTGIIVSRILRVTMVSKSRKDKNRGLFYYI